MAGEKQEAPWPVPKFHFKVTLGDKGEIAFQEVSQKSGKYQNPAKWYLALSFIKVERFGEAQPVLEDLKTTKDYGVRSITILNELFPESNP